MHCTELRTIFRNRDGTAVSWFHPRATLMPDRRLVMTMQPITGSDYFHEIYLTESTDEGRSWSQPTHLPVFDRVEHANGIVEGVCDVVPQFHPQSDSILALGHNVYYRDGSLFDTLGKDVQADASNPRLQRHPTYAVRDRHGRWSAIQTLAYDPFSACNIYTAGCSEFIVEDDGTLLIAMSFGHWNRLDRMVTVVHCRFDGHTLTAARHGSIHELPIERGLLEPSLARHEGRTYMTVRAEDGHGHVGVADDGLHFQTLRPWTWEDGTPLAMSTTQQHWLQLGGRLHLVYTRQSELNRDVMRWRAPLYAAEVDTDHLVLRRASERVIIPMYRARDGSVARMGNFHTTEISADEAIVTVGETLPDRNWQGDTLLARVHAGDGP